MPIEHSEHHHFHEDDKNLDNVLSMSLNASCDVHPNLTVYIDGEKREIIGSSCIDPSVDDADIFVSLDEGAPVFDWEKPWYEGTGQKHIRLPIKDMSVPEDTDDFIQCIEYISDRMKEGKKIHVGCVAGHGRTGLFLSALVQYNMGEDLKITAIDYVRENYCQKAVETPLQVLYLHYVFGVEIPNSEIEDVNYFKKIFLEEVGITIEEILEKDVDYDEIYDVMESVESIVYRTKQNYRIALANQAKENILSKEPILETTIDQVDIPKEVVESKTMNSFKPF